MQNRSGILSVILVHAHRLGFAAPLLLVNYSNSSTYRKVRRKRVIDKHVKNTELKKYILVRIHNILKVDHQTRVIYLTARRQ